MLPPARARGFVRLLIPGYIYPGAAPRAEWDRWAACTAREVSWIIANPGSPGGPGTFTDTNYVAAIAACQAQGIGIFGYVDTNFAARSAALVQADVDSWKTFYGINDIFLDNVSSGPADLAYYTTQTNYVRSTHAGAKVMLNHGTDADIGYVAISDIQCTFEGTFTTYQTWVPAQAWEMGCDASRICHLVYSCGSNADVDATIAQARRQNVGHVRAADVNNWFVQNAFFAEELTQIDLLNQPRRVAGWTTRSGGR